MPSRPCRLDFSTFLEPESNESFESLCTDAGSDTDVDTNPDPSAWLVDIKRHLNAHLAVPCVDADTRKRMHVYCAQKLADIPCMLSQRAQWSRAAYWLSTVQVNLAKNVAYPRKSWAQLWDAFPYPHQCEHQRSTPVS